MIFYPCCINDLYGTNNIKAVKTGWWCISYHLTLAKGYDADQPRTISKVTETH